MEELDYWRLCEELNIVQASLLVVGEDPVSAEYVEGWEAHKRAKGYEAAKMAICGGLKNYILHEKEWDELDQKTENLRLDYPNAAHFSEGESEYLSALFSRSITGELVQQSDFDMNGNDVGFLEGTIDVYRSTVNVDSLKQWLRLRLKGFATGFFFPERVETVDFLDPHNPRYAPKLAASVKAWQAVTDGGSKSPKQALNKWLREHAAEFKLTNDDGRPVEQAIEDCSKVANWKQTGGAPKTPSR